jgi:hypothetical protein
MIVALRISVVRRVEGLYVLGNGSALGNEVPPGPGDGAGDACGDGDGCGVCETNWLANENSRQKQAATRMIEFIFTSKAALTEVSLMRAATFSYKPSSESNGFVSEPGAVATGSSAPKNYSVPLDPVATAPGTDTAALRLRHVIIALIAFGESNNALSFASIGSTDPRP